MPDEDEDDEGIRRRKLSSFKKCHCGRPVAAVLRHVLSDMMGGDIGYCAECLNLRLAKPRDKSFLIDTAKVKS